MSLMSREKLRIRNRAYRISNLRRVKRIINFQIAFVTLLHDKKQNNGMQECNTRKELSAALLLTEEKSFWNKIFLYKVTILRDWHTVFSGCLKLKNISNSQTIWIILVAFLHVGQQLNFRFSCSLYLKPTFNLVKQVHFAPIFTLWWKLIYCKK